ncbi:MAG: hypothetical protein ACJLS2_00055 [Microcella pacifica]
MKGTGSISIEDGPFDQIPIGPLTDITSYFGRCTFNHYGVADRVVGDGRPGATAGPVSSGKGARLRLI